MLHDAHVRELCYWSGWQILVSESQSAELVEELPALALGPIYIPVKHERAWPTESGHGGRKRKLDFCGTGGGELP